MIVLPYGKLEVINSAGLQRRFQTLYSNAYANINHLKYQRVTI
jgi:hypothetical protein